MAGLCSIVSVTFGLCVCDNVLVCACVGLLALLAYLPVGLSLSAAAASLHLLLPLMSFLLLWVVAACSGSSGSSGIECGIVVRVECIK